MDDSLKPSVSFQISWAKPCRKAYVSGNFNDFALTILSGDTKKFTNIMARTGRLLYRFKIDGIYQIDPEKPKTQFKNIFYNYSDIVQPSLQINSNIEKNSEMLSEKSTNLSSHAASINTSPFRNRTLSHFRRKDTLRSVIKLQAFFRMVIHQRRYKNYLIELRRRLKSDITHSEIPKTSNLSTYERLKRSISVLKLAIARSRQACIVYKSRAQTARPELKRLELYSTVKNFKTGSHLMVNLKESQYKRLRESKSPVNNKSYY